MASRPTAEREERAFIAAFRKSADSALVVAHVRKRADGSAMPLSLVMATTVHNIRYTFCETYQRGQAELDAVLKQPGFTKHAAAIEEARGILSL